MDLHNSFLFFFKRRQSPAGSLAKVTLSKVSLPAQKLAAAVTLPRKGPGDVPSSSASYIAHIQQETHSIPAPSHDCLSGNRTKVRWQGTCCFRPSGLSAILRHKKEVQQLQPHRRFPHLTPHSFDCGRCFKRGITALTLLFSSVDLVSRLRR